MEALAEAYRELARYDDAETLHREALAIKRRVGDSPSSIAASLNDLGLTLSERGTLRRRRAAAARGDRRRGAGSNPTPTADVAVGLNNLAQTLRQQGRLDDAATALDEAIAIRRQRFGNDHPLLANVLGHLGQVRNAQGISPGPSRCCARRWPSAARPTATTIPTPPPPFNNLASLLHDAGNLAAAEPFYRLALASTEQAARARAHPDYAVQVNNLASLLEDWGRLDEAEPLFRASLDVRRTALRRRAPGGGPGAAQPGPRRAGARPRRRSRAARRRGARPAAADPAGRPRRDRARASACWARCAPRSGGPARPSGC